MGEGELVLRLADAPSAAEVAAAIELLLASDQVEAAAELLRAHPRTAAAPYIAIARGLARLGRTDAASPMYVGALLRSVEDRDLLEEFADLAPARFLEFLDEHEAVLAVEYARVAVLERVRAKALHALGRSREALELVGSLDHCFTPPNGDVPADLWCERWQIEAWMDVAPATVERRLRDVLASTRNDDALILMARLLHQAERFDEWPSVLEAWLARIPYDEDTGPTMVALVPYVGWQILADFVREHPGDWIAVLALADHHLAEGRTLEAERVLGSLVERRLGESFDHGVLVEALRRAPHLSSQLDRRVELLIEGGADPLARSTELGRLGDVFWELGALDRADAAWSAAIDLDADRPDPWRSHRRRAQLGVPFEEA